MNVPEFDKNYYESQTYVLGKEDVLKGLEKGVFYEKDGAVWVDNTPEGLDEKVLLRRDGTSVYMTQDIGTAIKRFDEYPGLSTLIYTVGNEQDYHFQVLFIIIIGGMGSILGNFLGAAFIVLFPLLLSNLAGLLPGGLIDPGQLENIQKMIFGALIIVFLIREPEGLARLWQQFRARLRRWPLRY